MVFHDCQREDIENWVNQDLEEVSAGMRLTSERSGFPVKFVSTNGVPTNTNYQAYPQGNVELGKRIHYFEWNSVEKIIDIKLRETPSFESLIWINHIIDENRKSQKSAFVDVDANNFLVDFRDSKGNFLSSLKFSKLNVVSHSLKLDKDTTTSGADHVVKLVYEKVAVRITQPEFSDLETEKDREWQEIDMFA